MGELESAQRFRTNLKSKQAWTSQPPSHKRSKYIQQTFGSTAAPAMKYDIWSRDFRGTLGPPMRRFQYRTGRQNSKVCHWQTHVSKPGRNKCHAEGRERERERINAKTNQVARSGVFCRQPLKPLQAQLLESSFASNATITPSSSRFRGSTLLPPQRLTGLDCKGAGDEMKLER